MSIRPEITVTCLKESRQYQGAKCPIGTFIVRLYWKDYSQYVRNERKLDGVYLLKDSKNIYHRTCEFAVTSLQSLEYLLSNCDKAGGIKGKWFRRQTEYAVMKFRGFAQTAYEFVKPIKVAVTQVKQSVSNAVQSAKDAVKKYRRVPQSWNECKCIEDVQYIFNRTPEKFRTDKFTANYLAAYAKFVPSVPPVSMFNVAALIAAKNIIPIKAAEALAAPQVVSIDDLIQVNYVPGEVQFQSLQVQEEVVEVTENEYRKLLRPVLDFKKPHAFLKEIGFKTGTVIGGHPRASKDLFEKVVKNCWKNQVSVSQLRDIIAAG
jgi:hypothetical protein